MDTKTCEAVLRKILEMKTPLGRVFIKRNELEQIFSLSADKAESAIEILKDQGLIDANFMKPAIDIRVHPKAIGYFERKEEAEQQERKEKWSERRWNLFQMAISIIVSFILGISAGVYGNIYYARHFTNGYPNTKSNKSYNATPTNLNKNFIIASPSTVPTKNVVIKANTKIK